MYQSAERGPGFIGYQAWDTSIRSAALKLSAVIQEYSSSVPSYPNQCILYWSLHQNLWSIFEPRILDISKWSSSPVSISTGPSGGWARFGIVFGAIDLSWETWKTGWIVQYLEGSRSVYVTVMECWTASIGDGLGQGQRKQRWEERGSTLTEIAVMIWSQRQVKYIKDIKELLLLTWSQRQGVKMRDQVWTT